MLNAIPTTAAVDCLIVGGSYAGLSAALTLGRSLRKTIVIDEGLPCNRFAPHSQNFLTHDGSRPSDIAELGRQQIQSKYQSVQFVADRVESAVVSSSTSNFQVTTQQGYTIEARKIIFASGVKDIFPDIPGFAECWGKSVIHCPYCHGFEYQSQPTGLFMNAMVALHMAPIVRNLTPDVTLFCQDLSPLSEEQLNLIKANQIPIITSPITQIKHDHGQLTGVVVEDGREFPLKTLYAHIPYEVNCKAIMESLGCTFTELGFISVTEMQKASSSTTTPTDTVPGIFACGDATTMFRSVANAVRGGNVAGAVANMELCAADFAAAAATAATTGAESTQQ